MSRDKPPDERRKVSISTDTLTKQQSDEAIVRMLFHDPLSDRARDLIERAFVLSVVKANSKVQAQKKKDIASSDIHMNAATCPSDECVDTTANGGIDVRRDGTGASLQWDFTSSNESTNEFNGAIVEDEQSSIDE